MRARSLFPLLFTSLFILCLVSILFVLSAPVTWTSAESMTWTNLQGPSGGPVAALALSPGYAEDAYMLAGGGRPLRYGGAEGPGLFASTDSGLTWQHQDGPPRGAPLDIAFSPDWRTDGTAVVAYSQGLWITEDYGATWQERSSMDIGGPSYLSAVALASPAEGQYTLLTGGIYGGIHRSADGGVTWTFSGDPGAPVSLRFAPDDPTLVLAATNTGIWRSTDGGLQWTSVTTMTHVYDVAFAAGGSAYATFDERTWLSTDKGLTWQPVPGPHALHQGPIGLSADGAGFFTAAGAYLYRYSVADSALVTVTTNLRSTSIKRLVLSPLFAEDQTLLVGDFDGVWISRDAGATFVRSEGFAPMQVRELAAGGTNGDLFAGGEFGIWRRSAGKWEPLNAGIQENTQPYVSHVAISPFYEQDQTVFVSQSTPAGLGSSLHRSVDRGRTWQWVIGQEYINQVVLSPGFATDRRLFLVAVHRILSSSDGGDTWNEQPFWGFEHTVEGLAISPSFAQNQVLVAVGNGVYRSDDGGATWHTASAPPPLSSQSGSGWRAGELLWTAGGRLYLSIYTHDSAAPYGRHDQLWVSYSSGETWSQVTAAPDRPVAALAAGPSAGGGEALYVSTFDDNNLDDRVRAPDLYVTGDAGVTWHNLGAIPMGPATLVAASDTADRLWAGSYGVWLLESGQAPTATPDPVQQLLRNGSFESEGEWRIPDTAYNALRSQGQHYDGSWSMRTGIVDGAANVRSYSDFSQDVTLPLSATVTLRLQRWPASGASRTALTVQTALAGVQTLEQFEQVLRALAADVQYGMLIEQPHNRIHFLFARLDNGQRWVAEEYDLSAYAGKTVRLQFGTFNNGVDSTAAQYFDAMRLLVQPPATPTPVPTPTPVEQVWLPYMQGKAGR